MMAFLRALRELQTQVCTAMPFEFQLDLQIVHFARRFFCVVVVETR